MESGRPDINWQSDCSGSPPGTGWGRFHPMSSSLGIRPFGRIQRECATFRLVIGSLGTASRAVSGETAQVPIAVLIGSATGIPESNRCSREHLQAVSEETAKYLLLCSLGSVPAPCKILAIGALGSSSSAVSGETARFGWPWAGFCTGCPFCNRCRRRQLQARSGDLAN